MPLQYLLVVVVTGPCVLLMPCRYAKVARDQWQRITPTNQSLLEFTITIIDSLRIGPHDKYRSLSLAR